MSGWRKIQFLVPPLSFDIFRFHVLLPSSVPFIPGQDRLVICGLGDQSWSLSQAVGMRRENSVQGNHQMVGLDVLKNFCFAAGEEPVTQPLSEPKSCLRLRSTAMMDRTGREEDQLHTKIPQSGLDNNLQTQLGKVVCGLFLFK